MMKKIKITLNYMIACFVIAISLAGCATGQNTADDAIATAIEAQADTKNADEQLAEEIGDITATDHTEMMEDAAGSAVAADSDTQDITEKPDTWDNASDSDAEWGKEFSRTIQTDETVTLANIPVYDGTPYIQLEKNIPDFTEDEKKDTEAFETYSELDSLGRCGQAYANICPELQPTEERGVIGNVRPSGWHTVKYNDLIDGNYLYNRCHLIAYCLAGENANEKNLITGTRYLNTEGMLPFEEMVNDYVDKTGNHVLYRVTPQYEGDNLVASGVEMEGWSVEDAGTGICFHVYCYNVQPGIEINYADGTSWENASDNRKNAQKTESVGQESGCTGQATGLENDITTEQLEIADDDSDRRNKTAQTYILNTNTKKIHRSTCSSVSQMKETNKQTYEGTVEELENMGYAPCKKCNP